jgi:GGDEF domain-containing protein
LPSTESTILANWHGPKTPEPAPIHRLHFALKQTEVSLDFYLENFFRPDEVRLHFFTSFAQLVKICQRYTIDTIVIGGKTDFIHEINLVQSIKQNVFLSMVPVVLYHPNPGTNLMVAAYEAGAEEFLYGDWKEKLVRVRIRRVIERNRRDLALNPSTRLPGPASIEREISRQLHGNVEFAVCYGDLDNFKAFNDYYGYFEGDKVIRLTATIMKDIVFDLSREGFVGHIAGDDFILVIPAEAVDTVCGWIIRTFDALVPYCYEPDDRKRGYITTLSRHGDIRNFPILSISIAVTINSNGKFKHVGEMSKMLADLKRALKRHEGSNYMIERRRKY